jgi:hypothetical protein
MGAVETAETQGPSLPDPDNAGGGNHNGCLFCRFIFAILPFHFCFSRISAVD